MTSLPTDADMTYIAGEPGGPWTGAVHSLYLFTKEGVGGSPSTKLTVASGLITPTQAAHTVDTEGGANADDLTNIALTNLPDGRWLILRPASTARVVTVKHAAGGTGQVYLAGSRDCALDDSSSVLVLERAGDVWREVASTSGSVNSSGGLAPYDPDYAAQIGGYSKGACVLSTDGAGIWISTANSNTGNPTTAGTSWAPLAFTGKTSITVTSGTITLSPTQYSRPVIEISGSPNGSVTIVFPNIPMEWTVVNSASIGENAIIVRAAGESTGYQLPWGGASIVACKGTSLASPAIQGVLNGGTGATSAEGARSNLGAAVNRELSAYTGIVSTRCTICTSTVSAKSMNSGVKMYSKDSVTLLNLMFANWYFNGGETDSGVSISVTASVEYPEGVYHQVKWGGGGTVSIAAGANSPLSDDVLVVIPKGAKFWVNTFQVSSGTTLTTSSIKHIAGEDSSEQSASTLTDKTMAGGITNDANTAIYGPLLVVGNTTQRSVLIIGDSRNDAASNTFVHANWLSDRGNIAHAIGPVMGYINAAKTGTSLAQIIASHNRIAALADYVTDVIIQGGINDLGTSNTVSLATGYDVANRLSTIATYFPTKRVWACTIEPRTSSSDNWMSIDGQTKATWDSERVIYNNLIRGSYSPLGFYGYFDFADAVEPRRNAGVWNVSFFKYSDGSSTVSSLTSDGVHLNDNGHWFADAQRKIDPRVVIDYLGTTARCATRDEWDEGRGDLPVSMATINRNRFVATKSSDQTGIVPNVTTTLTWDNVIKNGGWYDSANSAWYPPRGWYRVHCSVTITSVSDADQMLFLRVYKGATLVIQDSLRSVSTTAANLECDRILFFDGQTYVRAAVNVTGSTNKTVSSLEQNTFFEVYAI